MWRMRSGESGASQLQAADSRKVVEVVNALLPDAAQLLYIYIKSI